nr:MAG TPA: hypothetical protein [Caudoviricetes sp.]
MGMVTARRGEHFVKVSRKTFENALSKIGYVECGEVETQPAQRLSDFDIDVNGTANTDTVTADPVNTDTVPTDTAATDTANADTVTADAINTTPISEMNKEMLLQYASVNGIDLQDATTVRDIRKIIQAHVKASKMQ